LRFFPTSHAIATANRLGAALDFGHTRIGCEDWARYYHPGLQRFISEDPIGFGGGDVNLYAYVGNSPTNFDDPLGLDALSDLANLSAGFGDTLTFGGTAWIRGLWTQEFGLPDVVDASSTWNLAGRKTAAGWSLALSVVTGPGGIQGAASLASNAGKTTAVAGRITGYTRHGLNQAISREGTGVGVRAILDAVRNPQRIVPRSGGIIEYIGAAARVRLNEAGQVVTVIARGVRGFRITPGP